MCLTHGTRGKGPCAPHGTVTLGGFISGRFSKIEKWFSARVGCVGCCIHTQRKDPIRVRVRAYTHRKDPIRGTARHCE